MKGLLLTVALVLAAGHVAFATTTDSIEIVSGGLTATINDNGACVGTGCGSISGDTDPTNGTDTINGSINGWTIHVVSGTSNSPSLQPFGLDLTSLTAACSTASCTGTGSLEVHYSDKNFNVPIPAGGFTTTYSTTQTGTGSTASVAFFDNTNTIFGTQNLIGVVGPFTTSSVGSKSGGTVAAVPLYSLQLVEVFSATGTSSFSVDANITAAVPEPAGVVLLGSTLLFLATFARKKLLHAKRA